MEAVDRVRQTNPSVSAGQNYPGESKHELRLCARGRLADAARSRATRSHRCAAAGGKDHFAEGNCESDSSKLSGDSSYPVAGGRAAGGSDGFAAGDRLRDLSFKLRRKRAAPCASGGNGAGARKTPRRNETRCGVIARQPHATFARL